MRSAKNERPLVTASPESVDDTTASTVEVTRGSSTTAHRPERALVAPSIRVQRSTASVTALSRSSPPGPRAAENPTPVWLSASSPAMVSTARLHTVRLAVAVIPVELATAASAAMSP